MNWKETIEQIEKEKNEKIYQAAKTYVVNHSPYGVGDIFTDHMGPIKILRISYRFSFLCDYKDIAIVYYGIELRKSDFQPKKVTAHRWAYLSNEVK